MQFLRRFKFPPYDHRGDGHFGHHDHNRSHHDLSDNDRCSLAKVVERTQQFPSTGGPRKRIQNRRPFCSPAVHWKDIQFVLYSKSLQDEINCSCAPGGACSLCSSRVVLQ
ncbi:hypothetical protein C7M84_004652 [Penaeus vannamei]|uniref:Uncharacterized protein n=1 Tax=Penaeus vannamei TaxID=6689 RepID=A0A3R7P6C7_PENVA|nr:hypothetical protein C7M84_004652 [Penaeus vannamei]